MAQKGPGQASEDVEKDNGLLQVTISFLTPHSPECQGLQEA